MVKNTVAVFYGAPLAHEHEKAAVNRLRGELQRRGISATLLVNFVVSNSRNGSRQVDLVVLTADRCLNVELKRLDPQLPLIATPNGPWRQVLPGGQERSVGDHNYYDQALQQTYALSDAIQKLASGGKVPAALRGKFFKHIDTVVCVDPHLPPGSSTPVQHNVSVVGLDVLPDRIAAPGPGLAHWSPEHFETLFRGLDLYAEGADEESEVRRQADLAAVQDYRFRFREFYSAGLFPFVPTEATIAHETILCDAGAVADQLAVPQQRVLITGASGDGKTHLAKHTAVELSNRDQMVVWISADAYERGQFDQLLRRSVAPYSTEEAYALLAKAAEGGGGCTVVVDALEKCPDRPDLIQDLHALQQRHAVGILATALSLNGIEPLSASTIFAVSAPTDDLERDRLSTVYGVPGVASGTQYRTRYSIRVAAQVSAELPADATTTDVTDAYIRKQAGDETVRAGLRYLAHAMDDRVITALPIREAEQILRRCPALMTAPAAIDAALNSCPLVTNQQGFVRFEHDLLGRFLAAEHFVLAAEDGTALGQILAQPTHHDLQETALLLETDATRRYDTLRQLAQWKLNLAAVLGKFGDETAKLARADITELLIEAAATAADDTLNTDIDNSELTSPFGREWTTRRQWTVTERALLAAAGAGLRGGFFLREITALMDATNVAILNAIAALQAAGSRSAISEVIGSTFKRVDAGYFTSPQRVSGTGDHERGYTAATLILTGVHTPHVLWPTVHSVPSSATAIWQDHPDCYGRLYLAAVWSNPIYSASGLLSEEDAANLPDLVQTGLALGGYHLRLELLEAVNHAAPQITGEPRQRIIEVLNTYTPAAGDWASGNLIIEALARFGEINPAATLEDLAGWINDVLAEPDDPHHRQLAAEIVGRTVDNQEVLGPYDAAVSALPEEQRLTLLAMAVMSDPPERSDNVTELNPTLINVDGIVGQLADGSPSATGIVAAALERAARHTPGELGFFQSEIMAHLHGLRGWAKITTALPEVTGDDLADPIAFTWRLVDELVFMILRGTQDSTRATEIWNHLVAEFPQETAIVLKGINMTFGPRDFDPSYAGEPRWGDEFEHRDLLATRYPEQVRQLLEWVLTHRDEFPPMHRRGPFGVDQFAIRTLGLIGTAETADLLCSHYVLDPELGAEAVKAKRAIDARLGL